MMSFLPCACDSLHLQIIRHAPMRHCDRDALIQWEIECRAPRSELAGQVPCVPKPMASLHAGDGGGRYGCSGRARHRFGPSFRLLSVLVFSRFGPSSSFCTGPEKCLIGFIALIGRLPDQIQRDLARFCNYGSN